MFRNVALSFRWKLYKPFFECPVPPGVPVQPSVTSSQVTRTRDDHGVFKITPNMGTLPPNESADFMLEFAPREVLKVITMIWSNVHSATEKFENAASFQLLIGLPSTLIHHKNEAFWKRSLNQRYLNSPAVSFSCLRETQGSYLKTMPHNNHVISLTGFLLKHRFMNDR